MIHDQVGDSWEGRLYNYEIVAIDEEMTTVRMTLRDQEEEPELESS